MTFYYGRIWASELKMTCPGLMNLRCTSTSSAQKDKHSCATKLDQHDWHSRTSKNSLAVWWQVISPGTVATLSRLSAWVPNGVSQIYTFQMHKLPTAEGRQHTILLHQYPQTNQTTKYPWSIPLATVAIPPCSRAVPLS